LGAERLMRPSRTAARSGRAGSRQIKDADVSFVSAGTPIVTATTFIFVGEPY